MEFIFMWCSEAFLDPVPESPSVYYRSSKTLRILAIQRKGILEQVFTLCSEVVLEQVLFLRLPESLDSADFNSGSSHSEGPQVNLNFIYTGPVEEFVI